MGDFRGGRHPRKVRQRQSGQGKPLSHRVGEILTSLLLSIFSLAGRPLLLHSCFVCVAVAGAFLPLSTQGEEQRGQGVGWLAGMATCQDIGVVSSPPLPQGCPGLHQHLQHAPDVLPDAGTSTTMAHQPCGLCEKWQSHPRVPPPISLDPQPLPRIKAYCPKLCSAPNPNMHTS